MTETMPPRVGIPPRPAYSAWEFDSSSVQQKIDAALSTFLNQKLQNAYDASLRPLIDVLREFVSHGGKRMRPLLCVCGWYAAGGSPDDAVVVEAAASLELFHAFALIHDDVMDRSDTRRGRPSVHRTLASFGGSDGGDQADWFGVSAAILLGDLALVWSNEMLAASAGRHGLEVRAVLDAMRAEVMFGQYLDLLSARVGIDDMETALRVLRYKTAKYTVERPLHVGATLAGADERILSACTAFALPIGEAFQLRDDLLGVFGDPSVTGKSTVDDLREGKRTALIAIAMRQADSGQAGVLRELFGMPNLDADGAAAIRAVLEATKARETVENMITTRRARALSALARSGFPDKVSAALQNIAFTATERTS